MKTTRKDFEAFKTEFLRWQRMLGLIDYQVTFYHKRLENNFAEILVGDHVVSVTLNKVVPNHAVCDMDPVRHARHEAIHLAVWRLYKMAGQRFASCNEIEDEWETLTRRLEYGFDHMKEIEP